MGRLGLPDVPRDEDRGEEAPRSLEVGFTGSRDYQRPDLVESFVRALARKYPGCVVVSGGRGIVDKTAERVAANCGLRVISYRPEETGIEIARYDPLSDKWSSTRLMAHQSFVRNCFLRNSSIAFSDRVVGFWDLQSRGTADCLSKARGKQRELFVYGPDGAQLTSLQVANQLKEVLG